MNAFHFNKQGFALIPQLLCAQECEAVAGHLAHKLPESKSTRTLLSQPWCADLSAHIRQHAVVAELIPADYVAVQCTYFEKSPAHNWLVPIHQDLSIPVAQRVDHPSLRGWSQKEDALYVQAPLDVLQQLVAVRVHIDDCAADNGPLRVVPGSHLRGPLAPSEAVALRHTHPEVVCVAPRGAALVMRPLLLHASSKSTGASQRRVLHYLFGSSQLPLGLRWGYELANQPALIDAQDS
jgi:ectoine hydroxylase-related dioxygenase (phytanoyl-CoA dioxygenase family)